MKPLNADECISIEIIDGDGAILKKIGFTSIESFCRHVRQNALPEGRAYSLPPGLDLRGGYLHRAKLAGAHMPGVNLEGVCLSESDLTGANMEGARP
jgi:uncharacterized protein YjbI with pentapeptide repeats